MSKKTKSPLFIVFTTVLVDLIGFGMVIPLVSLYGRHFGASGLELSVLGAVYSLMQFLFAPIWGGLSDRIGRRPVILFSLLGSTLSYIIFAMAPSLTWLLLGRAFSGICAANISTAQAYIADITTPADRAKGMGLIGAAFGIGFTLGPPLGGIASHHFGLAAPGYIAAAICGINFVLALFRLPESLPEKDRNRTQKFTWSPLHLGQLSGAMRHQNLAFLLMLFFFVTFAFSNMEQTLSLLFQSKFGFETGEAGYKTGLVLMSSGVVGAIVQGGLIRRLVPKYGEVNLLLAGLVFNIFSMAIFPFSPTYAAYFFISIPLALGSALVNPSLSAMISKSVSARDQGKTMGVSQGLGSLARALGPFCGLLTFAVEPALPYVIACFISVGLFVSSWGVFKSSKAGLKASKKVLK